MESDSNLVICQGLGPQQPWSHVLTEKTRGKGIPVWNEPLPGAENKFQDPDIAAKWVSIFRELFTEKTTAVLHSASAIAGLVALDCLKSNLEYPLLKNVIILAGWLEDPEKSPDPQGTKVRRTFGHAEKSRLFPFLKLVKKCSWNFARISNSIRKKITIVQSLDDPYVHPDQAQAFLEKLPGSELLEVKNAGHFEYHAANNKHPEQNRELPESVQKEIEKFLAAV